MLAALQLYCDFSGCMDIAGGISQMLGITLPRNFNHPFFSKTAPEFWRRWHITLGAWFKDYVYMPLAVSPRVMKLGVWCRSRFGKAAGKAVITIVPLTVVWLLTGLWHGTGVNYLAWGLYWGVLIILSTLLAKQFKRLNSLLRINTSASSWRAFQMARTFMVFTVGRMITIPNDLAVTCEIIEKAFTDFRPWELVDGTLFTFGLIDLEFGILVICIVILWGVSFMEEHGACVRDRISEWNLVFRCAFWACAVLAILVFGIYGPAYDVATFAYMNF